MYCTAWFKDRSANPSEVKTGIKNCIDSLFQGLMRYDIITDSVEFVLSLFKNTWHSSNAGYTGNWLVG